MHLANEVRAFSVIILRPEADCIREVPCVRPAADRKRLGFCTGDETEGIHTGFDFGAFGRFVERRRISVGYNFRRRSEPCPKLLQNFRSGGCGHITAVERLPDFPVFHADHSADNGERGETFRHGSNPGRTSVISLMNQKSSLEKRLFRFGRNVVIQQIGNHDAVGIFGALRQRCMAGNAAGCEMPEIFTRRFCRHIFRALQLIGSHSCFTEARNGIGCNTALDTEDILGFDAGRHAGMPDAFFSADQRKIGIGAETEQRSLIVCKVMLHILHTRLLIGSEKRTDRITQADALLLQEFERIHADD